jgi:L-ascorbate metabolism protein UlaG (beta-lactamase superfamily)
MKLIKYEHSCLVLEKDNVSLVIDPGVFSTSFTLPKKVVGVVVTHEHSDHIDEERLKMIFQKFPEVKMYAPQAVVNQVSDELKNNFQVVRTGEKAIVGGFELSFVGGQHEVIRDDLPVLENIGVIVDGVYYHPGDSHFVPEENYVWLGIPQIAPWSKISETDDFVRHAKPQKAIQIHDALLSEAGHKVYDGQLKAICEKHSVELHMLQVGEGLELEH